MKVTYCSPEGMFLCGSVPIQTAGARCLWWESWICCGHNHIFPQGVLAAITLVGGGAGDGGARAGARSEVGLLCSVAVTALLGAGSDSKLLEQKS